MKKTKIIIGTVLTIATPIATVISCSNPEDNKDSKATKTDSKSQPVVETDKQKLQKGYDYLTNYSEAQVKQKPSFVTGVTNDNVLLKVFGIKTIPTELKGVTFSNIKLVALDNDGWLKVSLKMTLNKEVKTFNKTIKTFFTVNQRDKQDILDLDAFRFKTSLKQDIKSFYHAAPLVEKPVDIIKWGFDVHDKNKSFRGKTYAEWFKGMTVVGVKDLNDIAFAGDPSAILPIFPAQKYGNRKYDYVVTKVPEPNGRYSVELTLQKGNATATIYTCIIGWPPAP